MFILLIDVDDDTRSVVFNDLSLHDSRYEWNGIDFKVREAKRLMGLKVHQDGVKLANSLEWRSAVASVR